MTCDEHLILKFSHMQCQGKFDIWVMAEIQILVRPSYKQNVQITSDRGL